MLNRLQYISQGFTAEEQMNNIRNVLDSGCGLIQLRFKNADKSEFIKTAGQVKNICSQYKATLLINDHVDVAKKIDADGVHLGLNDMAVNRARTILGNDKIIGGTANTLEDVLIRVNEKCNYIGLGPFRFTITKKKLSLILSLQGYQNIMSELANRKINIPVYAVGGIVKGDIDGILDTGVYGIAVSGTITNQADKKQWIENFNLIVNEKINNSGQGI